MDRLSAKSYVECIREILDRQLCIGGLRADINVEGGSTGDDFFHPTVKVRSTEDDKWDAALSEVAAHMGHEDKLPFVPHFPGLVLVKDAVTRKFSLHELAGYDLPFVLQKETLTVAQGFDQSDTSGIQLFNVAGKDGSAGVAGGFNDLGAAQRYLSLVVKSKQASWVALAMRSRFFNPIPVEIRGEYLAIFWCPQLPEDE